MCLLWLRKKEEDQERLMDSDMNPNHFDDEATNYLVPRRSAHKRDNDNEVFEMEVFHYSEGNDESPVQCVWTWGWRT